MRGFHVRRSVGIRRNPVCACTFARHAVSSRKRRPPLPDAYRSAPPAPPAATCYHIGAWGNRYFGVNQAGHVAAYPAGAEGPPVDLAAVMQALRRRGVRGPVTLRLRDLLGTRVRRLHAAFQEAIDAAGYDGTYRGVYPIKVNQYRHVVEALLEAGDACGLGLECGSKAELVAALPYALRYGRLLLCNGCKDAQMMRLLLAPQQAGARAWPVLERRREFDLLMEEAGLTEEAASGAARANGKGITSGGLTFGARVRLSTCGAGLWSESSGEHSKFGLSLAELLEMADALAERPALRLRLLHFHLGSQIARLASVREATTEAARIYAALRRRGVPVDTLDIGGGLGVPYEAGNPEAQGYVDYTLGGYARAVVEAVRDVCDAEHVPHPALVSESGRALAAYHAVFVTEVLDVRRKAPERLPPVETDAPAPCRALHGHARRAAEADALEALHAALGGVEAARAEVVGAFRTGALGADARAQADQLYWAACAQIARRAEALAAGLPTGDPPPAWLQRLRPLLADHYLCDFSVFRSLPDHWALRQRFPIMPLHRLDEPPTRRATLADLTCDSDGAIKDFVTPAGAKHVLELHPLRAGEPYYLGFFLVGAYQDVLGDKHNLFGPVAEALIGLDAEAPQGFRIAAVRPPLSVAEQLEHVHYTPQHLARDVQQEAPALHAAYAEALHSSTYLDPETA